MVGGAKPCLESNHIPARNAWRAQTKSSTHQKNPQRMSQTCLWVFECLLWSYGSAVACYRGRGCRCSRPGYGISPLEGGHHSPKIEPPELTQDWGNRLLEDTNKTLCASGPRRMEQWPPQEDWPRISLSVLVSPAKVWVSGGLLQGRGHWVRQQMSNQYSWLKNPWRVWKGKKIEHWKMNSPSW